MLSKITALCQTLHFIFQNIVCVCGYAGVCAAHMHVSQSASDEVAEGWTDREIQ